MTRPVADRLPCGCPRAPNATATAGAFGLRYGVHAPHCTSGWHQHPEARIVLPLQGGFATAHGARALAVRHGEALYRPPGDSHSDLYSTPVACLAVLLPLAGALPAARDAFIAQGDTLFALARALAGEMAADDVAAPLVREGLALLVSTIVLQQRVPAERGAPPWLATVRERLEDDVAEAPTLSMLASSVGRDPAHVAATFKRVYGHSVGLALRRLRLARARACLDIEPACSLSDVALRCGFADQSHFTRHFRALFGVTPGQYRQRQRPAQAGTAAHSA